MALPTASQLTSPATTNAQMKGYLEGLRNFIASILGTTETASAARASLGAGSVGDAIFTAATVADVKSAAPIQSGTLIASTSGTAIDFTDIPSWARRVTVMFSGVSTSGTSPIIVQLGDSGGMETNNYFGSSTAFGASALATINHATGFAVVSSVAAPSQHYGSVVIERHSGTTWVCRSMIGTPSGTNLWIAAGAKAPSSDLDRIRITTAGGTDTFDGGSINIMWE